MLSKETVVPAEVTMSSSKFKDYQQLVKPNLSFFVVFSSVIGYLLVPGVGFNWLNIAILFLGGALVTSGANTINQILERDSDRLMKRTMLRPLPDKRMGVTEAWILAACFGISGVVLMGVYFNFTAAVLSFISLILYAFAYTPMKRIHSVAIFIGAIPGAMPPLIGWVAATNDITQAGGWALFAIQFFWQFPHFWAIAWLGYEDYLKAGIRLLPSSEGKTSFTGLQCTFYTLTLIPLSMVPYYIGMSGKLGMWICVVLGLIFLAAAVQFYNKNDRPSAKRLMFASLFYLPLSLLGLLFDKV